MMHRNGYCVGWFVAIAAMACFGMTASAAPIGVGTVIGVDVGDPTSGNFNVVTVATPRFCLTAEFVRRMFGCAMSSLM